MRRPMGFVVQSPDGWTWDCCEEQCVSVNSFLGVGDELPTKAAAEAAWRNHRHWHARQEVAEIERFNRCRCNCCTHAPPSLSLAVAIEEETT